MGGMRLNLRELHARSIFVPDSTEPLRFSYCFFTDSQRKLRSIKPANIVSQNGEVFCLKLSFVARQKQKNIDFGLAMKGIEYLLEEREQMYQAFVYSRSLSSSYHVRLGDRLPALEGTLYCREVVRLEWAARRWGDEEYNFASLHPNDFHLLSS